MAKRRKTTQRKAGTVRKSSSSTRRKRAPIALAELYPGTVPPEHVPSAMPGEPPPALPARRSGVLDGLDHESLAVLDDAPPPPPAGPPAPLPARPGETSEHARLYERLAALLVPYARELETEMHPKIGHLLKARSSRTKHEVHFGAVQILPDAVAFHLFPLYSHPELVHGLSPELLMRLRGTTCFHLEALSDEGLAQLAELTQRVFARFVADGVA